MSKSPFTEFHPASELLAVAPLFDSHECRLATSRKATYRRCIQESDQGDVDAVAPRKSCSNRKKSLEVRFIRRFLGVPENENVEKEIWVLIQKKLGFRFCDLCFFTPPFGCSSSCRCDTQFCSVCRESLPKCSHCNFRLCPSCHFVCSLCENDVCPVCSLYDEETDGIICFWCEI